jgi:hypothetical protein
MTLEEIEDHILRATPLYSKRTDIEDGKLVIRPPQSPDIEVLPAGDKPAGDNTYDLCWGNEQQKDSAPGNLLADLQYAIDWTYRDLAFKMGKAHLIWPATREGVFWAGSRHAPDLEPLTWQSGTSGCEIYEGVENRLAAAIDLEIDGEKRIGLFLKRLTEEGQVLQMIDYLTPASAEAALKALSSTTRAESSA